MSKTIDTLSPDEIRLLLNYLAHLGPDKFGLQKSTKFYLLFAILLETGLRISELSGLVRHDLFCNSEPAKSIIVRTEIAKNHKEREIPTSTLLYTALKESEPYINTPELEPVFNYSIRQLQRIVSSVSAAAIGRAIHPHILRHTFATRLMRVAPMSVVQKLLGHSNITSTQIYTHPNSVDLRDAVNKM